MKTRWTAPNTGATFSELLLLAKNAPDFEKLVEKFHDINPLKKSNLEIQTDKPMEAYDYKRIYEAT